MSRSRHPEIRALLRANDDGMTVTQISAALGARLDSVRWSLYSMPDAYIDRWDGPIRGQYAAVWCVVVPPENCPHPTKGGDA
jgi:hypothetical protein